MSLDVASVAPAFPPAWGKSAAAKRPGQGLIAVGVLPGSIFLITMLLAVLAILAAISLREGQAVTPGLPLTLNTWAEVFRSPYTWTILLRSLRIATITAILALAMAYPTAWMLSRLKPRAFVVAMALILSPMLFSVVVRGYGWILLLLPNGPIAAISPAPVIYTEAAVIITLLHAVLPFAVLPVFSAVRAIPRQYFEAASDLGASRLHQFVSIFLPLTAPGAIAALQLVFTLSLSSYVVPRLMGGGRTPVLASDIYANLDLLRWPVSAVEAIILIATALAGVSLLSLLGAALDWRRKGERTK